MTETDIPLLGPGRELTQAASQTAMAIGSALRERRFAADRYGWSTDRAAERVGQQHRRAADPPVREMKEPEFDLFHRDGSVGRPGYETRHTSGSHGEVRVTVGPMPEGRGWGLVAEATAPHDPAGGGPGAAPSPAQARVVAKSEAEAKELADELLARGYPGVQRLHEFGQYAARRAAQAQTEVRETREQLLQRTADTIRQVWHRDPELAERMIQPSRNERAEGATYNGALGALAHELEKLEDGGYAMNDVLARIDQHDALRRARNAAAMAHHFVKRLAPDLQVINLDDGTEPEQRQRPESGGPTQAAASRAGDTARPGPPAESIVAADDALDSAMRAAELPVESVRTSASYARLQTLLAEQHARGRDLDPLLSQLPTRRLADARDPAAYLRAVVESRLAADPLRKTRPDLHSAAELVERCLPRDASRAVLECDSWPGLATRIGQWRSEGLPVTTMLESLPADHIRTAADPAQFARLVLNSKAASHRKQRAADTSTDRPGFDPDWLGGPEPTLAPRRTTPSASTPASTATPEATATTVIDVVPSTRAIPLPPAAVDQLDPDSAVDRIALHAARGTGGPGQDAAIERLLSTHPSGVFGDPAEAAAADARAEHERDRAELADQDAAHADSTSDDPTTTEREDLAGHDDAHTRGWDADQARALADSDTEIAAAARAGLSYRTVDGAAPADRATSGSPSPGPRPVARREPARPVTPTLRPVRVPRPNR